MLVLILLASCGGPRLVREVPAGVSLEGSWRLVESASDNPRKLIAEIGEKVGKRMRERPFDGPRAAPRFLVARRYEEVLGDRLGSDFIVIEQTPDRVVISRGDFRRSYTPGGRSVVSVPDGVADQRAGWDGREFVVDVRPQVGPHLTERFGLTADGQLVEHVELEEDGLPKLEFTRVYRAGDVPARVLPTSN